MKLKEVLAHAGCILALVILVLSPVLIHVGVLFADSLWLNYKNRSAFAEKRSHLEAIVRKLDKELTVPRRGDAYSYSDRLDEVKRIEPAWDGPAGGHWYIRAERLADGHLRVVIETDNRGHAGVWTLNYLSRGRTEEEVVKEEEPWSATRLDSNWWMGVFTD